MRVYAIGDLHLPGSDGKFMDVFGLHWENHWEKIADSWSGSVTDEDVVLIPGDISWAMDLNGALPDLETIAGLPGHKIIIRGNHDYWWASISKVRRFLPPSIYAIQNDSISMGGVTFCGTRGWIAPGTRDFTDHDLKVFNREVHRLGLSLSSAAESDLMVVLLHYPPFDDKGRKTAMAELLEEYPVRHTVFGHLHGNSLKGVIEGYIDNICYHLVSCDYLDFSVKLIMEV